ncbi:FAD:protein FMN transferase [Roseibium suaedae]|uniref:FAD:protein FMN transferase n=1 Tax=Roseibium suaedae TaxID=735517 RepID=A0A1M7NWN7_9HYPH|nr:FAD:protein FMN transferase [Roseibium suaedae]SHN08425.1 thiamine biosynthesis lipoprotein [Roseibium suaedae]
MPTLSRRRFLSISAGASALSLALPGALLAAETPPLSRWQGSALGSAASITLAHPQAKAILAEVLAEIERLEAIFSLYRTDSALVRLNAEGELIAPPFELVECLGLCGLLHRQTDGAFNPAVQPLWTLYADNYGTGQRPTDKDIEKAKALSAWEGVAYAPDRISLEGKGRALTLNGIAQGFIADKVARLLTERGLTNVMIDTGELRALGGQPDGHEWTVTLAGDRGTRSLRDRALATSAPLGTTFDQQGLTGHILDPRTGLPAGTQWRQVSVSAPSAAIADGLSTAFCLMPLSQIEETLKRMPEAALADIV